MDSGVAAVDGVHQHGTSKNEEIKEKRKRKAKEKINKKKKRAGDQIRWPRKK